MSRDTESTPGSAPGAQSDRDLLRQWLKEQVARRSPILERIADLHKDALARAIRTRAAKRERSRQDRLRNTSVTGLLRKRADVNPMYLTRAGIATAEHILELGAGKLAARAGIDADAASKRIAPTRLSACGSTKREDLLVLLEEEVP